MIFYRGTTNILLDDIHTEGKLSPSPSVWADEPFFDPTLIYVTIKEEEAWSWAESTCKKLLDLGDVTECEPVVLLMDRDHLSPVCRVILDPVYEWLPPQEEHTLFGIADCNIPKNLLQYKKKRSEDWETIL